MNTEEINRIHSRVTQVESGLRDTERLVTDIRLLVTEIRHLVDSMEKTLEATKVGERLSALEKAMPDDLKDRIDVLENQGIVVRAIKWGAITIGGGALTVIATVLASRILEV